jgi:hypothetical protein
MSLSLNTILLVLALIAFILAAIGFTWRKTEWISIGLALWMLSEVLKNGLSSLTLNTIFLILAFIAFVLAAVGWRYRKINLIAVGLALWVLSLIFH